MTLPCSPPGWRSRGCLLRRRGCSPPPPADWLPFLCLPGCRSSVILFAFPVPVGTVCGMFRLFPSRRAPDEGFSLIELLVTLVVMGVLLGITIPTFLGQRKRAQDKEAQAALHTVQTGARALLVWDQDRPDYEQFSPDDDEFWSEEVAQHRFPPVSDVYADPAVSVRCAGCSASGASEAAKEVSIVNVGPDGSPLEVPAESEAVFMAALSRSGSCWVLLDDLRRGVSYGVLTEDELPSEGCDALFIPTSAASSSEFPVSP